VNTLFIRKATHANNVSAEENIKESYWKRNIYILSNSETTIKELDNFKISSKLVWDCYQSLTKQVEHNRVKIIWMPRHRMIEGNEINDHLARRSSLQQFTGPKPGCGISERVAK
jgi:ribonuclease HI